MNGKLTFPYKRTEMWLHDLLEITTTKYDGHG